VRYRWPLAATAIIFLLVASYIEHQTGVSAASSWVQSSETYIGLFKEIGFAFFIALIVIITVEERHKQQHNDKISEERK